MFIATCMRLFLFGIVFFCISHEIEASSPHKKLLEDPVVSEKHASLRLLKYVDWDASTESFEFKSIMHNDEGTRMFVLRKGKHTHVVQMGESFIIKSRGRPVEVEVASYKKESPDGREIVLIRAQEETYRLFKNDRPLVDYADEALVGDVLKPGEPMIVEISSEFEWLGVRYVVVSLSPQSVVLLDSRTQTQVIVPKASARENLVWESSVKERRKNKRKKSNISEQEKKIRTGGPERGAIEKER